MKKIFALALAGTLAIGALQGFTPKKWHKEALQPESGFTLWQLPSQFNTIGNSYVIVTQPEGRVVVIDGGVHDEHLYLRGFLAALGNHVDTWIITHPHNDHCGALTEILHRRGDLKIDRIVHSRFSESLIDSEEPYNQWAREFYQALDTCSVAVTNLTEPGLTEKIDGLNLKVLAVTNEEIRRNPYNNSSIVLRLWDPRKSVLITGDAGAQECDKLLDGPYRADLDCDYLQMPHHGQRGGSHRFFTEVKFRACLWPTPLWVWNNDAGGGFNTHTLKTIETRQLMDSLGIAEHHVTCTDGLFRLD